MTLFSSALAAALGASVVYEEYRGDFAQAAQVAAAELTAAQQGRDMTALSAARLGQGVVYWLQGEPLAALASFAAVDTTAPTPALALLTFAYRTLATHGRFLLAPSGAALGTLEIGVRWDQLADGRTNDEQWATLWPQVPDPATQQHAAFLYKVLHNAPIARYVMEGSRLLADETERTRRAGVLLNPLFGHRQALMAAGATPLDLAPTERLLADLCYRAGYREDAQTLLTGVHHTYETAGDPIGVANCWLLFGDWLAAPNSSPLVWNRLMIEGDWNNSLSWVRERAEFSGEGLNLATAAQAYTEAAHAFAQAHARRGLGAVALRQGYLAMLADNHEQCAAAAAAALTHFTQAGDGLGGQLAQTHHLLAQIALGASIVLDDAASAIGAWGQRSGAFSYATGLGLLLVRQGRYWLTRQGDHERAMRSYRLAHTLFTELGAPDNATQTLADQGVAYSLVGEGRAALVAFTTAREGFAAQITRPAIARAAWQKAVLAADELCQLYQIRQDADGLARSTTRLHDLYTAAPTHGVDLFGDAFPDTLANQVAMRVDFAAVLVPLFQGLTAREQGDAAAEAAAFAAAHQAVAGCGPGHRAFLQATVLSAERRDAAAALAFQQYLDQGGAAAGPIGDLAQRMAERFGPGGQAIAAQRPEQSHRFAARFFANVHAYDQAHTHLRQLEALAGAQWWQHDERPWEAHLLYGEVYEGLADFEQALAAYAEGVAALETRRQLQMRDEIKVALAGEHSTQSLYLSAARAALRAYQVTRSDDQRAAKRYADQLCHYAERGKARALLDLMTASANGATAQTPELLRWRQASAQLTLWRTLYGEEQRLATPDPTRLAHLTAQITTAEAECHHLEVMLPAAQHFLTGEVMTLDELTAQLPAATLLLYYYFLGDTLLAWAVTSQGLAATHYVTTDIRRLNQQLNAFHCQCGAARQAMPAEPGITLVQTLLAPFADLLTTHERLWIVPYGAGHQLPWHALPWQGEYLGATHQVRYLPSASALRFLRPTQPINQGALLVVGNPTATSYQLPASGETVKLAPLPAAELEARFVATLFPDHTLLLGAAATASAVRHALPGANVIHLATHGYLAETAPLLSAVLLANGEALSLYALMGLHLDADLVVLSACETGRGQTTGGDDLFGLTRGLLAAGARAVMVSLWAVDDLSTALLMGEFYRQVRQAALPVVALQKAQQYLRALTPAAIQAERAKLAGALETPSPAAAAQARHFVAVNSPVSAIPDYSHPYYWAPFILVG